MARPRKTSPTPEEALSYRCLGTAKLIDSLGDELPVAKEQESEP